MVTLYIQIHCLQTINIILARVLYPFNPISIRKSYYACYLIFVAATEVPSSPLLQIRERMTNLCVNVLLSYRKYCATVSSSGQLILPEALKLLPLYTIGVYFIYCENHLVNPRFYFPFVWNFLYFDIQFLLVRCLGANNFLLMDTELSIMLINNCPEKAEKHL